MRAGIITTPYWWEAAPPAEATPAEWQSRADVVIIGGGFTGFGAAIPLARAGLSVVIVEKDKIGAGASTRNGGITSGNLRHSYDQLAKKFGPEKAAKFYQEAHAARQDLINFISDEHIDCDLQLCGRFVGATKPHALANMQREAENLSKAIGVAPILYDKAGVAAHIDSDKYCGGVWRDDIGGIHPAKLLAEMHRIAASAGVLVFTGVAVSSLRRIDAGADASFTVDTTKGPITAGHVIAATNAYSDSGVPWLRRRLVPVISEMIATEELGENRVRSLMPSKSMYSESLQLGHYFRPSPDGKRILLGGRRMDADPAKAAERLRAGLVTILPDLADCAITHHWFGFVAFPFDQLPKLTVHDGVIYPAGYCGSGTVWARWLGQKAAQMVLADLAGSAAPRPKPAHSVSSDSVFADLPFRSMPFYSGEPWFLPIAMRFYALKDKMADLKT
ncbi:MAG: NAD(P)/FAD-dependent oxidoreductase [Candidatus Puniceispirillaceae bacterium]